MTPRDLLFPDAKLFGIPVYTTEFVPRDTLMLVPTKLPPGWERMTDGERTEWLSRHSCVIKGVGE